MLAFTSAGRAGTITITSGPNFTPSNAFSNNTIQATSSGSMASIFGSTNVAITANSSASIAISGNFTANTGDVFSFFYNFSVDLNSAIPVTFTIQGTAHTFTDFTAMDTGTLLPGSHSYSGMKQTNPAPFSFSGTFDGSLTFNFGAAATSADGTPPIDTLFLDIPNNGLLFGASPTAVPEPSTYALISTALGLFALVSLRRKRA
jgi:hypothetical protein